MAVVTILGEQTFSGFTYQSQLNAYAGGGAFGTDLSAFTIELGKTYTVVWDGVSYEVTAKDASALEAGVILLGNGAAFGLGGDEPFAVAWYPEGVTFFASDDAPSHTISIYNEVATGATILEEQTVVYDAEDDMGLIPYAEPLVAGETYIVVWNGIVYECVATDFSPYEGFVAPTIGNLGALGPGDDNGVPFAVMYVTSEQTGGVAMYSVIFLDGSTTATLAIYEAAAVKDTNYRILGSTLSSIANAVRDKTGKSDLMYPTEFAEAINSIDLGPKILSNVNITPDFSNGDYVVTAPSGYALAGGTVKKPDNLKPENILKDVNIAGIIGAAVAGGGGGGDIKVAGGSFTPTSNSHTIEHGLGVFPDFVFVYRCGATVSGKSGVQATFSTSAALQSAVDLKYKGYMQFYSGVVSTHGSTMTEENYNTAMGFIYATETTIRIGSDNAPMVSNSEYGWIAIGGLA